MAFILNTFISQDNLQILRDLSLLQIQMRDLEGYRVRLFRVFYLFIFWGRKEFCLLLFFFLKISWWVMKIRNINYSLACTRNEWSKENIFFLVKILLSSCVCACPENLCTYPSHTEFGRMWRKGTWYTLIKC